MKNEKLLCGVVGVGYLGQHHARIYSELENTELVGVYDSNPERAKEIAEKYSCKTFDSIEALGDAVDAASVAVPTDLHAKVAAPLFERNCNLLIEKPLCVNLDEAREIVETARSKNLLVQVGHIEHFNPVMAFMEENVRRPRFITADRLAPFNPRGTEVGVVLDLMIHDIGIVLQLANSPISRIDAVGVNVLSVSEDIANARITFENSCVANLNVSRASRKKLREIRIFQDGSYMSLDFMNQTGHLMRVTGPMQIETLEVPIEKSEPLKLELQSFANCVINRENPKVDATLGRRALEVALEITRQIKEFSAVK